MVRLCGCVRSGCAVVFGEVVRAAGLTRLWSLYPGPPAKATAAAEQHAAAATWFHSQQLQSTQPSLVIWTGRFLYLAVWFWSVKF